MGAAAAGVRGLDVLDRLSEDPLLDFFELTRGHRMIRRSNANFVSYLGLVLQMLLR